MLMFLRVVWCRLFHASHWTLAKTNEEDLELFGCMCDKCKIFHVVEVLGPDDEEAEEKWFHRN